MDGDASDVQAVTEAREAARRGDPNAMLAALYRSGLLDGLQRAFERRWHGQVSVDGVEEAIAQAVDEAYTALTVGKSIYNLSAWLWKVTENSIKDRWGQYQKQRADVSVLDTDEGSDAMEPSTMPAAHRSALRAEAMRRARALAPKLGQTNIVRVMEYILAAVELGVTDLPAAEIARALDLPEDTVRVLRHRAFQRLTRLAQEDGLHLDRRTLAQLGQSLAMGESDSLEVENNE